MKGLDWRGLRKLPEALAHKLEAMHPTFGKQVLSYASRVTDPVLLMSSFSLLEWSDERVGLRLKPNSLGPIVNAAEFMIRSLIGRHVIHAQEALTFNQAKVEVLSGVNRPLHLRLELVASEREAWIRESQHKGAGIKEIFISVWSNQERRLGEVVIDATLSYQPLLPGQP